MGKAFARKLLTTCSRADAAFKQASVEHYHRHGGDLSRTAVELCVNYWTLRDWVEVAQPGLRPTHHRRFGD